MNFYFNGKDLSNNRIKGHYEAISKASAIDELLKQGIFVNRIYRDFKLIKQKKMKDAELISFLEEWYSLEIANINTQQIILIIKDNTTNQSLKNNLQLILLDLNSGIKLSDAFLKCNDYFPEIFLKIIIIGLNRGNLKETLSMLIDYYKEQSDINSKMKSALIYPKILSVVFLGAFILVCKLIVPSFYSMFQDSNVELNKLTNFIFKFLMYIGNNLLWIGVFIISIFLIIKFLLKTEGFKKSFDQLKLKLQKRKLTYYYSYLFTRIMCLLWSNGVGKIESIDYASSIIPNSLYKKKLYEVQDELSRGMLFGVSLENKKIFDLTLCKMLTVGEKSNFLEKNMENAAKYYHYRYSIILNKLVKLIEPLLIIVMALAIGFIIVVIFIPMLNAFKMVM